MAAARQSFVLESERGHRLPWLVFTLIIVFLLQVGFAWHHRHARILWQGVPLPPSQHAAEQISFGDTQVFYRLGSLMLQQMGDSGSDAQPLSDFNYDRIIAWLTVLTHLDTKSTYAPTMAAYYFAASQKPEQVRQIVTFLSMLGDKDPAHTWRWQASAVNIASHRLKDQDLALKLAYKLASYQDKAPNLPIWAKQMPAFVLDAKGDKTAAVAWMQDLKGKTLDLSAEEKNFMDDFISERQSAAPRNDLFRLR